MNNNYNFLPAELFDLLQNKAFDELDYSKQQWVLSLITEEEYHTMHGASLMANIHSSLMQQESNIKASLLKKVESLSPSTKPNIFS